MIRSLYSLGTIRFSASSLNVGSVSFSKKWRWAEVGRLGENRRPAQQFHGLGADSITLRGVIFGMDNPGGGGRYVGDKQLDAVVAAGDAGSPLVFMNSGGRIYGKFVITDLTEERTDLVVTGSGRRQEYTLTLLRYGDDG